MKTTAIMCSYNEYPREGFESYLENSIISVKKCIDAGLLESGVFVDDGSDSGKDGKFVRALTGKYPIKIIKHEKNLGKAKAFLTGLQNCSAWEKNFILTLDADMVNFTPEHLDQLYQTIRIWDRKKMVEATYYHRDDIHSSMFEGQYSGIRLIDSNALESLWNIQHPEHNKWGRYFRYKQSWKGYRLEGILTRIISYSDTKTIKLDLDLREAGKGTYTKDEIVKGILSTRLVHSM